jgi:hypothetical protein
VYPLFMTNIEPFVVELDETTLSDILAFVCFTTALDFFVGNLVPGLVMTNQNH